MGKWLAENPLTFLMFALVFLVAVVGGVLVITDNAGTLSFEDYCNNLTKFALAVGVFGAGKAVKNGLKESGTNVAVGKADTVVTDTKTDFVPEDGSGEADEFSADGVPEEGAKAQEFPEAVVLGGHPAGDTYDEARAMPPGLQPGI